MHNHTEDDEMTIMRDVHDSAAAAVIEIARAVWKKLQSSRMLHKRPRRDVGAEGNIGRMKARQILTVSRRSPSQGVRHNR